MYQFHLSIGDWSGDGHGRSEDFTVASNAPVETVREAHYKIPEVTEVDIESICSEYGEDEIDAETVQVLKDMGFQFENSWEKALSMCQRWPDCGFFFCRRPIHH